jgi:hypothetical protein
MRDRDATVASPTIGHEAALHLKYWVWFYSIWRVLFGTHEKAEERIVGKMACIFKDGMVYLFM